MALFSDLGSGPHGPTTNEAGYAAHHDPAQLPAEGPREPWRPRRLRAAAAPGREVGRHRRHRRRDLSAAAGGAKANRERWKAAGESGSRRCMRLGLEISRTALRRPHFFFLPHWGMDARGHRTPGPGAPPRGGWYRETWRDQPADGGRGVGSAIYFLLAAGERSHWHRVDAAEAWHHYAGDPLELAIAEGGDHEVVGARRRPGRRRRAPGRRAGPGLAGGPSARGLGPGRLHRLPGVRLLGVRAGRPPGWTPEGWDVPAGEPRPTSQASSETRAHSAATRPSPAMTSERSTGARSRSPSARAAVGRPQDGGDVARHQRAAHGQHQVGQQVVAQERVKESCGEQRPRRHATEVRWTEPRCDHGQRHLMPARTVKMASGSAGPRPIVPQSVVHRPTGVGVLERGSLLSLHQHIAP